MERRNRSLEAFEQLKYINSLEGELKASSLELWSNQYLDDNFTNELDLSKNQLNQFSELFYQNIHFLKQYRENLGKELSDYENIKKFLK